jgi:hypothetical protein
MEKKSVGLVELETAVLECFLEKTPLSPLGVNSVKWTWTGSHFSSNHNARKALVTALGHYCKEALTDVCGSEPCFSSLTNSMIVEFIDYFFFFLQNVCFYWLGQQWGTWACNISFANTAWGCVLWPEYETKSIWTIRGVSITGMSFHLMWVCYFFSCIESTGMSSADQK